MTCPRSHSSGPAQAAALQSSGPKAWWCLHKSVAAEFGHFSNNKSIKASPLFHGEKMKERGVSMGEEREQGRGVTVTGSEGGEGPTLRSASPEASVLPLCGRTGRSRTSQLSKYFSFCCRMSHLFCSQQGLGNAALSQGGGQLSHWTRGT